MSLLLQKFCLFILLVSFGSPAYSDIRPLFKGSTLQGDFSHANGFEISVEGYKPIDQYMWASRISPFLEKFDSKKANRIANFILRNELSFGDTRFGFVVRKVCEVSQCLGYQIRFERNVSTGSAILVVDENQHLPALNKTVSMQIGKHRFEELPARFTRRNKRNSLKITLPLDAVQAILTVNEVTVLYPEGERIHRMSADEIETLNQISEILDLVN